MQSEILERIATLALALIGGRPSDPGLDRVTDDVFASVNLQLRRILGVYRDPAEAALMTRIRRTRRDPAAVVSAEGSWKPTWQITHRKGPHRRLERCRLTEPCSDAFSQRRSFRPDGG